MVRSDGNGNPEGPGSGSSEGGGTGRTSGEVHGDGVLPVHPDTGVSSHGSGARPVQVDNTKVDKHLDRLRWMVPLTAVAVLILGPIIVWQNVSTGQSSGDAATSAASAKRDAAQARLGNEIANCRALFNVPVTEATGIQNNALAQVGFIGDSVHQLVIRTVRAFLEDDDAQAAALLEESKTLELMRAKAQQDLVEANINRDEAIRTYNEVVEQAIDDPAGFLQRCKAEWDKP